MKRSLAISVSLMIAFLTACSGAGNGGDPAQTPSESADQPAAEGEGGERVDPFGKYEETVTFTTGRRTIANHNLPEGDTLENNGYSRYVLSRINVKVESAWEVDPSTYAEKVALSISSGDIPDVMLVDRKTFKQMLDAGVLEDLTDAFNDALAPSIRDFYDSYGGRLLSQTTIDGKIMGIPGTQLGGGHNMLWIRQDWLDRLGLEPPKTLDDVIAVAKAFMEKDPGGNGPGQTVGLVASSTVAGIYNSMLGLDTIFTLYGAYPKQWIRDASGNVVYGSTTPEMKEALRKLSEMYQSGIIDKEFALRKADDANALLASGKAGLMFGAWWAPYWPLSDTIKNNPKADWRPYLAPLDEGGKLKIYTQDPVNEILVVRKGYPHPEAIVKVLNAENELHFGWEGITPEGVKIKKEMHGKGISWGVMPIPLQLAREDNVKQTYLALKEALESKSDANLDSFVKPMYPNIMKDVENPGADPAAWGEHIARIDGQSLAYHDALAYQHPAFFGTTPTMEMKWATLQKLEDETLLNIILGSAPIDSFDAFVEQWKALGGEEITKEVAAEAK